MLQKYLNWGPWAPSIAQSRMRSWLMWCKRTEVLYWDLVWSNITVKSITNSSNEIQDPRSASGKTMICELFCICHINGRLYVYIYIYVYRHVFCSNYIFEFILHKYKQINKCIYIYICFTIMYTCIYTYIDCLYIYICISIYVCLVNDIYIYIHMYVIDVM